MSGTGLISDRSMLEHRCFWDYHPEKLERLEAVVDRCEKYGLMERCVHLEPRKADPETELTLIHTKEYIEKMSKLEEMSYDELEQLATKYEFVYFCKHTYQAALMSAGSAIAATEAVLDGRCRNSLALIRPPGHHASQSRACGFCIFNNVAICAKLAAEKYNLDRVLIVDWDVHAAQGTQYSIEGDDRILLVSFHRYQEGQYWPNLPESNWDHGVNTINIPLNKESEIGDSEYIAAFNQFLLPLAAEYQPELILVSCGFDAGFGDAIDGYMYNVTPGAYAHMTRKLMSISRGKVCAILEGGYFLEGLAEGAVWVLKTLLGDPVPAISAGHKPAACLSEVLKNSMEKRKSHYYYFEAAMKSYNMLRELNNEGPFEAPETAEYKGNRVEPDSWPTRNLFPPRSREDDWEFSRKMNEIVSSYKVRQPAHRLAVIAEAEFWRNAVQSHEMTVHEKITDEEVKNGVDLQFEDLARDVTLLSPEDHSVTVANWAKKRHKLKRILVVKICCQEEIKEMTDEKQPFYEICLHLKAKETKQYVWSEGIRIELAEPKASDVFFIFNQVVLPQAYSYNPQFVFYQLEGQIPGWLLRVSNYIISQLSCLANGYLIGNFQEDSHTAVALFRSLATQVRLHRTDSEGALKHFTPPVSSDVCSIVAKVWNQTKVGLFCD